MKVFIVSKNDTGKQVCVLKLDTKSIQTEPFTQWVEDMAKDNRTAIVNEQFFSSYIRLVEKP